MRKLKIPSRSLSRVTISDFTKGINTRYAEGILSHDVGCGCYNFDFSSGALTGGVTFQLSSLPVAQKAWTYRRTDIDGVVENILMFYDNGSVYYVRDNVVNKLNGLTLTSLPLAVNYRLYGEDVILICSQTDGMTVWNGVSLPYSVPNSPLITSFAIHYERMFVTTANEPHTLYFSDDLDPTNWNEGMTEGGFIQLMDDRGELLCAVNFLGYIYIFRSNGISRLTAYAEQEEFSVNNLYVSSGNICAKSVTLCGDRVLFACSDGGVYVFDGLNTKRILANLDGWITVTPQSAAAFYEGKYYLSVNIKRDEETVGCESGNCTLNGILVYDVSDGTYLLLRGYDAIDFSVTHDGLFYSDGSRLHVLSGNYPVKRKWCIPETDFGDARRKNFSQMSITSAQDISLKVFTEERSKTFFLKGKDAPQKIQLGLSGIRIGMHIFSQTANPFILRPSINFVATR